MLSIKELWYEGADNEVLTALRKLDSKDIRIVEEVDYLVYAISHIRKSEENTYSAGREQGSLTGYLRALYHAGLLTREERMALRGYALGKILTYYKEHKG